MVRVAVDAMGGDHAPAVVIEGALEAVARFDVSVLLVGPEREVKARLDRCRYDTGRVEVVHASETIQMDEAPAAAIRRKKDSSISVGIQCVKNGRADAFFSAGNTGAVVCGATLKLGLLETIERPGIAIVMPNRTGVSLIIDAGANINPKPVHLLQYAIMGSAYFEEILGKKRPTVGLLNVGEEEAKGTDFVRQTHQLIEESPVNFIGNVEGKDIFSGQCDVIVADGFVGNVTLKVAESIAETLAYFLKQELGADWRGRLAYGLARSCFRNFRKKIDYSEYGGAPLLGVDGIVIIGHGRSSAKAVMNAIHFAQKEVDRHINQNILAAVKKTLARVS